MPRLFVALDLPDEVKKQITNLYYNIDGLRWVKVEQLHLTLRFIGEVTDKQEEAIRSSLGAVQAAPFSFQLTGIGQFPGRGKPRVIWVGVTPHTQLTSLHHQIEARIQSIGYGATDTSFSPHITMARVKFVSDASLALLKQFFDTHRAFKTDAIHIDHFTLYSSTLSSEGASYKAEAIYSLANT
ncbi:MAG: RNA 2',3'-cyclic phosphodiesterase [Anaerolineae bacterium]